MENNQLESLAFTVRTLQRQNRLLAISGLVCVAVIAMLANRPPQPLEKHFTTTETVREIPAPPKEPSTNVVATQEFALRDQNGNVRWKVAIDDKGAVGQSFFDQQGKERINLGVTGEKTAWLTLYDTEGARRIVAYVTPENILSNASGLTIFAPSNEPNVEQTALFMQCARNQSTTLQLWDTKGQRRFAFYSHTNGTANQMVFDRAGKVRSVLHANDIGEAGQYFYDKTGTVRTFIGTSERGQCQWSLMDEFGRKRMESFTYDGKVVQNLIAPNGKIKEFSYIDGAGTFTHDMEKTAVEKTGEALDWIGRVWTVIDMYQSFKGE